MMNICDYCKKETKEYNEIILDGTDDFYVLEVCNDCYEILNDYYSPEDVDKIIMKKGSK
jgi:ribosome-binding protein aMBF1 (putative translation factor)